MCCLSTGPKSPFFEFCNVAWIASIYVLCAWKTSTPAFHYIWFYNSCSSTTILQSMEICTTSIPVVMKTLMHTGITFYTVDTTILGLFPQWYNSMYASYRTLLMPYYPFYALHPICIHLFFLWNFFLCYWYINPWCL